MTARRGRRASSMWLSCTAIAVVAAACGNNSTPAADCVKVVEESGETTDACLPVAPQTERVDLGTPTFTHPTSITNPLQPSSRIDQAIYGGHVEGKPFRTEVTRLPGTQAIRWRDTTVDTVVVQYTAYLDGRINEVALDKFAQADDGSVWYFGEGVSTYADGKVADTEGTWLAGDQGPPAMIMPAHPRVGDVYRPENAPGLVFEEVRVDKVDQHVAGPSGTISGAIEVAELHLDGSRESKLFAPGYGEFSTGSPGGDLEAAVLASPTDRLAGPTPAEFGGLSGAVEGVYQAAAAGAPGPLTQAVTALDVAWDSLRSTGIPPQVDSQMETDIAALRSAAPGDGESTQTAALRIAQNELDRARLALWARQIGVDAAAADTGFMRADVAALDRVWERTHYAVEPTGTVDAALQRLRVAADAEDLTAAADAAAALGHAVEGLRTR